MSGRVKILRRKNITMIVSDEIVSLTLDRCKKLRVQRIKIMSVFQKKSRETQMVHTKIGALPLRTEE